MILTEIGKPDRNGYIFSIEALLGMEGVYIEGDFAYVDISEEEMNKIMKKGASKMGCCGDCGCKEDECKSGNCKAGSGEACCSKDGSCKDDSTTSTETQGMLFEPNETKTNAYLAKTERMMSLFGFLGQMVAGDKIETPLAKQAQVELDKVLKQ
jgi:hypothetical protein